jgi:intracellular sulfur oxidation DsrE/DsrF family protein
MSLLPHRLRWVLALLLTLALVPAFAADTDNKPFAEKKVVLQISDDDASKQTLVLNVASNLISHYGPDRVDVEIVAFGPGLRLLFAENSNASRIDGLAADSGVRFSACENTTRKVTEVLGHRPAFNPNAQHVSAGVVRIVDLVGQGYILVKP